MKKQYTWSSERDAERYNKDVHSTIDGCISEAKECGAAIGDKIYVGECVTFSIAVDSQRIIEQIIDDAWDFADDTCESWADSLEFTQEDTEKLDKKLTQVITDFLIEHNLEPNFYQVNDIREVIVK